MKRTLLVSLAVLAATMLALAGSALAAPGDGGPKVDRKLEKVRKATAKYKDVDAALAAGYVATDVCVPNMGYHYANPALASDGRINPRKPEVLLYAPRRNGDLRLVAVEYFAATAAVRERPKLFGTVPFEGPMPGHEPGMPEHYDLHAWIFKSNPDGVFTAFNPRIQCPS